MNYRISLEFPDQMLLESQEPCISIFMPTSRIISNNKKDALVFKNLVREAKLSLEQKYSNKDIKALMEKLKQIELDADLWNHSNEGFVLFATLEDILIYRTLKAFKPVSIVSNNFHLKPLTAYFQGIETYTLLALEAESFVIYEGNHLSISNIELPSDAETTLKEALGMQQTEAYHTHGVYGGASDGSTFHGHGGRSDAVELDRIKFFRHVDRYVVDNISKQTKHPLILVAHKEHHADFKKLSINKFMLDESIDGSYANFTENDMRKQLEAISHKRFNVILDQTISHYYNQKQSELSSDQLIIVLKALIAGRVDTLLIEQDKMIPGKIDTENKQMIQGDLSDPETNDLLDDMVKHALLKGSKVFIVKKDKMPTTSGVAATFRY